MTNYTGTDIEKIPDEELFELAVKREARYILVPEGDTIEFERMTIPNKILPDTFSYKGPDIDEIRAEKARRIAEKHDLEDPENFVEYRSDFALDGGSPANDEIAEFYNKTWEAGTELAAEVLARALSNVRSLNIETNTITR